MKAHVIKFSLILYAAVTAPSYATEEIALRATHGIITKEMTHYVASVGKSSILNVEHRKTYAELTKDHCGRIDFEYMRIVAEEKFGTDDIATLARNTVEPGSKIELPACIRIAEYEISKRVVNQNEHFWSFYKDDSAGFTRFEPTKSDAQANYLAAVEQLNGKITTKKWLQAGDEVKVPISAVSWSSIELRPGVSVKQAEDEIQSIGARNGQEIETDQPNPVEIFFNINPKKLETLGACQSGSNVPSEPFDVAEVITLIERARQLKGERSGAQSVIIVPDTGMYIDDKGPFPRRHLDLSAREEDAFNEFAGITPFSDDPRSQHGMYVATLAMGGTKLLTMLDTIDLNIKLLPINLHGSRVNDCVVDDQRKKCHEVRATVIQNAVLRARTSNPIINLSVGRGSPFYEIFSQLNNNSNILFVAAAGNDGVFLNTRAVYPARHGGEQSDGRDNLITVAALDIDGNIAEFSNRGADYVEIASPGCLQRVLEYDIAAEGYRETRVSGTSFATPHVSFTAATLRTLWPNASPRQVKRRLLYAADISKKIDSNAVKDGRALNVVKALSIYDDVVEANIQGNLRAIRGSITESFKVGYFCGKTLHRTRRANPNVDVIKKIARRPEPPNWLVYWENTEGVMMSKQCNEISLSLTIREQFTNWRYTFSENDIHDIVFAELSY